MDYIPGGPGYRPLDRSGGVIPDTPEMTSPAISSFLEQQAQYLPVQKHYGYPAAMVCIAVRTMTMAAELSRTTVVVWLKIMVVEKWKITAVET